jgi:hypothetical protein
MQSLAGLAFQSKTQIGPEKPAEATPAVSSGSGKVFILLKNKGFRV